VSRCTPDSVKSLFAAVKSDVVEFVHVRGNMVNMNFMVGSLAFGATGNVEFKSSTALDAVSSFSSMLPSEMRSKAGSEYERSIRSMQTDQQSNNGRVAQPTKKMQSTFASTNPKRWTKEPLASS